MEPRVDGCEVEGGDEDEEEEDEDEDGDEDGGGGDVAEVLVVLVEELDCAELELGEALEEELSVVLNEAELGLGAGGLIVGVAAAIAVPESGQLSPHVVTPAPANAERAIRRNHRRGPIKAELRRSLCGGASSLTPCSSSLLASVSSPVLDSLPTQPSSSSHTRSQ
jgi:hypothetical protein